MASDEPDPCVTCGGNGDNDDDLIDGVNPSAIHFLEKTTRANRKTAMTLSAKTSFHMCLQRIAYPPGQVHLTANCARTYVCIIGTLSVRKIYCVHNNRYGL